VSDLISAFINWAVAKSQPVPVVTFADQHLFTRYEFIRRDEWPDSWWDEHRERWVKAQAEGRASRVRGGGYDFSKRPNALPWWLPCNAFLHHWNPEPGYEEDLHDHPRWSITIVLKGQLTERTPWGNRRLRPGSIVIRSRKYIHGFSEVTGDVWTLFIVGRRVARQSTYVVTAR
jgi:hypothetical protein